MRICAKEYCENKVPKFYTNGDGKKHYLQRRKFCFECSPFGQHNTKDLNISRERGICSKCGRPTQKGYNKSKCHSCYFNEKKIRVSKKVYNIVGYDCWECGYAKGKIHQSLLEFHHLDPDNKLFGLTTREFVGRRWSLVYKEIQKCVSLCCRCHREYHAGLISDEEIKNIYDKRWKEIESL